MPKYNIYAPICGKPYSIEDVGDQVFSDKMLGDGIAIKVDCKERSLVCPISGIVETIMNSKHAIVIKNNELEVLIHIGIDSCTLEGIGFDVKVTEKQKVAFGDALVDVDFELLSKNNILTDVIIVVLNRSSMLNFTKKSSCKVNDLLLSVVV